MSSLENWTWKPDTPAGVPAGARISAGKSGKVLMSLPRLADVLANSVPTSCMPSPESPQKPTVAWGSSTEGFSTNVLISCHLPLQTCNAIPALGGRDGRPLRTLDG